MRPPELSAPSGSLPCVFACRQARPPVDNDAEPEVLPTFVVRAVVVLALLLMFFASDLARVRSSCVCSGSIGHGAFVAVSDCGCSLLDFVLRHDLRRLHLVLPHVLVFDGFLLDSVLTHDLWRFRQLFHHLPTLRRYLIEWMWL